MNRNRLLNLYAQNARKGAFKAEGNVIYIYDMIVGSDWEAEWMGGVSPESFAKTLAGMTGDVTLRINSPGGDVFGGRAIAAAVAGYQGGQITAHVDGYAASAASLITVSAPRVVMAEGAFIMIHNAWTIAMGDAGDFLATAELLEKIDGSLAETYAGRGKKTKDEFAALMAAETWFGPDEAIEAGLADEKAEAPKPGAKASAAWNLSAYRAAPEAPAAATIPEAEDDAGRRARIAALRLKRIPA